MPWDPHEGQEDQFSEGNLLTQRQIRAHSNILGQPPLPKFKNKV